MTQGPAVKPEDCLRSWSSALARRRLPPSKGRYCERHLQHRYWPRQARIHRRTWSLCAYTNGHDGGGPTRCSAAPFGGGRYPQASTREKNPTKRTVQALVQRASTNPEWLDKATPTSSPTTCPRSTGVDRSALTSPLLRLTCQIYSRDGLVTKAARSAARLSCASSQEMGCPPSTQPDLGRPFRRRMQAGSDQVS